MKKLPMNRIGELFSAIDEKRNCTCRYSAPVR